MRGGGWFKNKKQIKQYKPPAPPTPNSIENFNMKKKIESAIFADSINKQKKFYEEEEEPHVKKLAMLKLKYGKQNPNDIKTMLETYALKQQLYRRNTKNNETVNDSGGQKFYDPKFYDPIVNEPKKSTINDIEHKRVTNEISFLKKFNEINSQIKLKKQMLSKKYSNLNSYEKKFQNNIKKLKNSSIRQKLSNIDEYNKEYNKIYEKYKKQTEELLKTKKLLKDKNIYIKNIDESIENIPNAKKEHDELKIKYGLEPQLEHMQIVHKNRTSLEQEAVRRQLYKPKPYTGDTYVPNFSIFKNNFISNQNKNAEQREREGEYIEIAGND
jgi:hypothetical protein